MKTYPCTRTEMTIIRRLIMLNGGRVRGIHSSHTLGVEVLGIDYKRVEERCLG